MWARISEIVLGIWLIASYWIFKDSSLDGIIAALFIILFASLSYIPKISKVHLIEVLPAGWLLYISYAYPTPWLPFFMQNYILTSLTLLIFAIIPTHASDHPRPWKEFLAKRPHSKEE